MQAAHYCYQYHTNSGWLYAALSGSIDVAGLPVISIADTYVFLMVFPMVAFSPARKSGICFTPYLDGHLPRIHQTVLEDYLQNLIYRFDLQAIIA